MYNPRVCAISIEKILRTPQYLTGEIENFPLEFLSSFLDNEYKASVEKAKLIDLFDKKYAKYKNTPLCSWAEEDAEQMVKDLKEIFS